VTPERWQELKKVLAAALERAPEQRSVYLDQACGDEDLRREVESLIAAHEQGDASILEHVTVARAPLEKGSKLGPYTILARIGAGGMGEVYRAHDPKLKRDVAIKVLPAAFVRDPERLARFQREARMLASLNHPNIAAIYGVEDSGKMHALVMELAGGPTLADRIRQGPIPIDEAIPIARQIADALEYAHEHGIIHRDLKPANVKVATDDTVKVLDFGSAKALETNLSASELADSPTISQLATEVGMLLGTPAYMSPEQAKGKAVDRRVDIWAFGCVLYEMLTGQMAFRGDTVTDTLAAVLKTEPDWSQLPAATPVRVRVPLRRCLQKDPKQRLRDIGDARISLDEVLSGAPEPAVTGAAKVSTPLWRRAIPWALFGATGVALAAFSWLYETQLRTASPAQTLWLQIPLPAKPPLHRSGLFAVSPDGRKLAFVATSTDGIPRIWIRSMDSLEIRPLMGTESVSTELFWSPDSRFVGFDAGQNLEKIDISGGPPETVCAVDAAPVGGSWNKDGVIIFGRFGKSLMRVSAAGGVATPLTVLNTAHGDVAHTEPWFLPDGRHFLYLRDTGPSGFVSVGSLDAKPEEQDSRRLAETGFSAVYVPSANASSGQLLFLRRGALMEQAFDARDMKLSGEPVPIVDGPIEAFLDAGLFSISATGTLVYWSRGNVENEPTWFDAQGKALGKVGEPGAYRGVSLSWDGTKAFLSRQNPGETSSLWLLDVARGTTTRSDVNLAADDQPPLWAADGRNVIFGVEDQPGQMVDIYEKPVSGAATATLLVQSNEWKTPSSWSADGRFLLYTVFEGNSKSHLWVLPLAAHQKPFPFHRTEFNEHDGHFSPDGHWVAYVSDESGRSEVYVRPFSPDPSGEGVSDTGDKFLISDGGGYSPAWRQDGRELYYLDFDTRLMAVSVTTYPAFHADAPRFLFQPPVRSSGRFGRAAWAPSPDGKRFLFLVPEAQRETPFTVVLNWQSLVKK
jgi:eukaryotic-like serine/threonine-protein kinase